MENKEQDNQFGHLEIDDDFFNDLMPANEEQNENENSEAEEQGSAEEDESQHQEEEQPEESPEQVGEDDLSDDIIYEKYGEDVNPAIVRHYEIIKDYFLLDEGTEFDGKNIEELYQQDISNRNKILAQKLLDRLPQSYRVILDAAIQAEEPLTSETYEYLLMAGQAQLNNTYDPKDETSVRNYVKSALLESGTDPNDVEDIVELYSDKGKLEEIAAKYQEKKDEFINQQKLAKVEQDQAAARERRKQDDEFKSKVDNVINAANYKNVRAATIKKYIYGTGNGQDTPMIESLKSIYSNPEALVTLADMISYYDPKTGKWDMSQFEKKEMTKQTSKVKESIESKISGNNAFKTPGSRKSKVDFDWDEVGV